MSTPKNETNDIASETKVSEKQSVIDKSAENYKEVYIKKYTIAFKVVNKMLENMEKRPIDDLTKFSMIDRKDIIKPENKKIIEDMEKEIFDVFDKRKCGWYRKDSINTYSLTFLKSICNDIGLNFVRKEKEVYREVDGERLRGSRTFYSIVKR